MATSITTGIHPLPLDNIEEFSLEVLPLATGTGPVGAYHQRLTCTHGMWIRKVYGTTIGDWILIGGPGA